MVIRHWPVWFKLGRMVKVRFDPLPPNDTALRGTSTWLETVNPKRMLELGVSGSMRVTGRGEVAVLTTVVTGGIGARKGGWLVPSATTVSDCVALRGGAPLSVIRNWKVFVVVEGAPRVVQVNTPVPGSMAAAGGGSKAGRSAPA